MIPFVSVVVPVLNRKPWVRQLVESLQAQTYDSGRYEIIISDNGSTDGTWEWLERISAVSGVCLRVVRNDARDKVPTTSRNCGARLAQGEIIAFIDSDCRAAADWIEKGVAAFRDAVGIVVGKTIPDPDDPRPALYTTREIVSPDEVLFDTCNIFYRREAFERAGGFASEFIDVMARPGSIRTRPRTGLQFGDDTDLGYRVVDLGYEWVFGAEALVMHHIRPQTLREWLSEPLLAVSFPYLASKHPELRRQRFYRRYFLTRTTALFDLLLLGCVLAGVLRQPLLLLLALPYLVVKARDGGEHLSLPMRAVRVAGASVRALIVFAVLAYSSLRFRTLVI